MKTFATAAAAFLLSCSVVSPVLAVGAVATAEPADVARDGYSSGISYNFKTAREAEDRALQECRQTQDAPAETKKLCRIIQSFENQCVAVALDPEAGTPGAGWALGDTLALARSNALQRCEETAGSDRRGECRVTAEGCDGRAK